METPPFSSHLLRYSLAINFCVSFRSAPRLLPSQRATNWLPGGTVLPCNLPHEDINNAFITANGEIKRIADLSDGSVTGTASLRSQAQIVSQNPTLKCVNVRLTMV